jgi:DNA-directed RNA polymerase subunit RPC12/RpoP
MKYRCEKCVKFIKQIIKIGKRICPDCKSDEITSLF